MSAHSAATSRPARLRVRGFRRLPLRATLIAAAVIGLLLAGWLWLRESSLVAVERVTVSGATGDQARHVRAALEAAASDMTTLTVDEGALRDAVARFPLVRDIETSPDLPHGLRIRVIERIPVGAIDSAGGATVVVAGDGTLLRNIPARELPRIVARVPPSGARVADRKTAVKVALLAAAPRRLRARVVRVTLGPQGLVAVLASGPNLRFGDGARLRAKWIAASRVLRDPAAKTAAYIDLRVPERPAAGGLSLEQGGTQVQPPPVAEQAAATQAQAPQQTEQTEQPAVATPQETAVQDPQATQPVQPQSSATVGAPVAP